MATATWFWGGGSRSSQQPNHPLGGCSRVEGLPGPSFEPVDDGIECIGGDVLETRRLAEALLQHTDGGLASAALQWAVRGVLSIITSVSATRVPRIVSANFALVEVDLRRKPSERLPRYPGLSTHALVPLIVSKREPPVGWRLHTHRHGLIGSLLSRHQPQT